MELTELIRKLRKEITELEFALMDTGNDLSQYKNALSTQADKISEISLAIKMSAIIASDVEQGVQNQPKTKGE